ncbi:hypothetical protein [Streptomyces sp. NPDC006134]|uniref:hypothetical protein n=1 Tax=Streptomyces sp. NPDC006134 TaxID=3154467 RepID=UPI0033E46569
MTTIAPEEPRLTSQTWRGHWHGFGPWIGDPKAYAAEGNRRPAHPVLPVAPDIVDRYHKAAQEFSTGTLPPLMTGHWLLKKAQVTRALTWTDVGKAVVWLEQQYLETPPFERTDGQQAYVGLDVTLAYARDALPRGVDVSCVYYTPSRSLFAAQIVCCPSLHHPDLPCPLPPS